METIVSALGDLLLKALPTFVLVVVVHFYLKFVFYRPLERVLRQRSELTEGARRLAEDSFQKASAKAAEYEEALRAARAEIYREQEETRRRWRAEHGEAVARARAESEERIRQAKSQIAAETQAAKLSLAAESDRLAAEIAQAILRRSPQ